MLKNVNHAIMDALEAILSGLNDRQKEAVQAPLGPVLVLAGAGSGKTKVLTHRIAWLIGQKMFAPENILALTFTNKAAKEMQTRVEKILAGNRLGANPKSGASALTMGTFHSVCARILRHEIPALGYTRGFVIYDTDDQEKILREICAEKNLGTKFPPSLFRNYISSGKNILQTPGELALPLDKFMLEMVRDVYVSYQNYLFKQNALDFDDLLMLTVKLLQNFPDVLARYQQQFKYIMVDEYQDTNQAQYILLRLLAVGTAAHPSHRNLFVVGDDAQSIYGFRGSNLGNILNFEKDFPDSKVIKLEQNYRSTKNILAVAQNVIDLNEQQKKKELWTENAHGEKIYLVEVEDEIEEAKYVAKKIIAAVSGSQNASQSEEESYDYSEAQEEPQEDQPQSYSILDKFIKAQQARNPGRRSASYFGMPFLPKEHLPLKDFAVLYRTHSQSRALEEVFLQAQIPYQIVGGVKFYQRKEIKDVLAYLRLLINARDLVALKRVINEPARGIGEKSFQVIRDFILDQPQPDAQNEAQALPQLRKALEKIKLPQKQYSQTQNFFTMLDSLTEFEESETLRSLIMAVLKKSGYEKWVRDGSETGETRWENIEELFTVAEKYENLPWKSGLLEFLEEVVLMTDADNLRDSQDSVVMMSLHQAKGLEFDTVFLTGLEDGILPHSRSLFNPSELAEEIRLAYVGITRARKKLYLIYAQSRRLFGNLQSFPPSRILKALPEDKIEHKTISRWN